MNCELFLPDDFILGKDRTLLADTFVAVFGFARTAHAGAESAPHALFERQLAVLLHGVVERMEHRQRPAGVKVIEIQPPFGDGRRDEAPDAPRTVDRRDGDLAAQRAELLLVEDLRRGVEAQHHLHGFSFGEEFFRQVVERRHAHAAPDEQGSPRVVLRRESVAQTRQQVERFARQHAAHLLRSPAHDLVDQRNRAVIVIADRDRAA